jgi:putative acetyltransferase
MSSSKFLIRPETEDDLDAIRQVNRLAFGRDDEARLVDALRDEGHVRISLVAEANGRVVGHILFGDLTIESGDTGEIVKALALAPLAVDPTDQRRGIGSSLVRDGLLACAEAGHRIVVVLGHPEFYSRFGFSAARAARLRSPFSGPSFMAAELVPGALEGIEGDVRYPPPFGID